MRCGPWGGDWWALCNDMEWLRDDVSIQILFEEFLDSTVEEIFGLEGPV